MKRFYWAGIYNQERLSGIGRIEECINHYGFITDFKFFSDLSVSLVIEIEERNILPLVEELTKIIDIPKPRELITASENECVIFFNITFTRGTGNLKIDVPSIPG